MDYIKCIRSVIVWSVFFLLMTALAPNQVRADMANWNTAFALQSESGRIKMMVALNPQPEPPLPTSRLIMEDSKHPLIKVPSDNPHFQILFALYDSQLPVFFIAPGTPDENGYFSFGAYTHFPFSDFFTLVYTINLNITTSGGGVPINVSWNWINPQPEPPGKAAALEFDFEYTHMSEASLSFQVLNSQGEPIPLSPAAPLPPALYLFGFGLLSLVGYRRLRKH